jgi:alpha-L-arabinofuranosidase
MAWNWPLRSTLCAFILSLAAKAQEAQIVVHADQVSHRLSRYLTGACIEDVNHEIYGGLYSQMVFGERFQEAAPPAPFKAFEAFGGSWRPEADVLWAGRGDGPKLISDHPAFEVGEVGVEVMLEGGKSGNAGLIVKVSEPGMGADNFVGYEIALDASGRLVLGRHRHNWEPISNVPHEVPLNRWLALVVRLTGDSLEVLLDGESITTYQDKEHPLISGRVGLRTWQREARFRNLYVKANGQNERLPFELAEEDSSKHGVSGQWRGFHRGTARGEFSLETQSVLRGGQRLTFADGEGEIGIENQGLNRWGMNFVKGRPCEGCVWLKPEQPTLVYLALESADGSKVYAESRVAAKGNDWQRLEFKLTPNNEDGAGRFAIKLKAPGTIWLGYAFLEPGPWGRFKGLPVRRDVTEALIAQGLTVMRYGGSMINDPHYRWKQMIGAPDRRPAYQGTWYPHSSNGWGIFDFLNFCEAAGFLGIPAVNMDEAPEDMADFMEYVNGPRHTEWGRRRAADGHAAPYRVRYLELGNEEAVNEDYWLKFRTLAEAIWAKDPTVILVVGDFAYDKAIEDPFNFSGAPRIRSLAAHKKILDFAREHGREVWFDVHIGTENPPAPRGLPGVRSFIEQLGKLSPGSKYKVAVFEFNANNHALKRALANALAINQLERAGDRIAIACSANCLQPYKQNDNGWNQGLLFLSPSQVWPEPPYYVTQMVSRNFLPLCLKTDVRGAENALDITACKSEDSKMLTLQVVNQGTETASANIALEGFAPRRRAAHVTVLTGDWDGVNTPENPEHIRPTESERRPEFHEGRTSFSFPSHSFTVLRFR